MIGVGIDAGSRAIKIVLMDTMTHEVITSGTVGQGVKSNDLAMELFEQLLKDSSHNSEDVQKIVATGYGRNTISIADATITEITCHARGVHHVVPEARTVVEIGGQDSKLLKLGPGGSVQDFMMNDRCAAGTGRFLEVVADRLSVGLAELGELASRSVTPAAISSMCIVFAETEIIGLLASGTPPEDIVAGVQNSIATRITSMAGKSVIPPVVFTGGVALVPGMDKALERVLGHRVETAPNPQMTGALGAALLACKPKR
ncbi:MAG: acyl-CoA dehydratase activase [Armatimonadota bacterium]